MTFPAAIRSCLRQFATFEGRARRAEYWWFTLFRALVLSAAFAVCLGVDAVVTAAGAEVDSAARNLVGVAVVVLLGGSWLALLVPTLAVTIRRLHDTDRSGWWYLLTFIPLAHLLVFASTLYSSQPGPNIYGRNPKNIDHYPRVA